MRDKDRQLEPGISCLSGVRRVPGQTDFEARFPIPDLRFELTSLFFIHIVA